MNSLKLRKILFWDTRVENIDLDKNATYVVDRIVKFGTLDEWQSALEFYGNQKIKDIVVNLRYIDEKTLNYLSFQFEIPKEKFRCYINRQSAQEHFPY